MLRLTWCLAYRALSAFPKLWDGEKRVSSSLFTALGAALTSVNEVVTKMVARILSIMSVYICRFSLVGMNVVEMKVELLLKLINGIGRYTK